MSSTAFAANFRHSQVQAILFDRKYYSLNTIAKFLLKHHYQPIKELHFTKNYYRVRLKKPNHNKKYRTKKVKEGLKFIIEIP